MPGRKPQALTLRAGKAGRYSATLKHAPSGALSVTVTLRQGATRLVSAATVD